MQEGVQSGNEMFVFIALYLFGLIPAWWADGKNPSDILPSGNSPVTSEEGSIKEPNATQQNK